MLSVAQIVDRQNAIARQSCRKRRVPLVPWNEDEIARLELSDLPEILNGVPPGWRPVVSQEFSANWAKSWERSNLQVLACCADLRNRTAGLAITGRGPVVVTMFEKL